MSASDSSQSDQAFVLHTLPWRETSLIVEMFTRGHGRMGMIAKGARRPRSALRGLLQPFQPLEVRWAGKGELRTLISAEWVGGLATLSGAAVMPGFYINELMVRLMAREDAHPNLFDDYAATLAALADQSANASISTPTSSVAALSTESTEPVLRRFECNLLREMGYAPHFDAETRNGNAVLPDQMYDVSPVSGISISANPETAFTGSTLMALSMCGQSVEAAVSALRDPQVAAESKRLLRLLLGHHLGQDDLQSRQVMRELVRI